MTGVGRSAAAFAPFVNRSSQTFNRSSFFLTAHPEMLMIHPQPLASKKPAK
jgi:hypothetical protein